MSKKNAPDKKAGGIPAPTTPISTPDAGNKAENPTLPSSLKKKITDFEKRVREFLMEKVGERKSTVYFPGAFTYKKKRKRRFTFLTRLPKKRKK